MNDPLTEKIIGCCFRVHSELGPGFIEKIYHNALALELRTANITHKKEETFKVFYQDISVGSFKVDIVVDSKVIVELKAVNGKTPTIFEAQVLSYLKASGLNTGLLVNFGNRQCQIKRLVV